MRKIVVGLFMSLDGVVESPEQAGDIGNALTEMDAVAEGEVAPERDGVLRIVKALAFLGENNPGRRGRNEGAAPRANSAPERPGRRMRGIERVNWLRNGRGPGGGFRKHRAEIAGDGDHPGGGIRRDELLMQTRADPRMRDAAGKDENRGKGEIDIEPERGERMVALAFALQQHCHDDGRRADGNGKQGIDDVEQNEKGATV